MRWWMGVIFPGSQFGYFSDSTQERVFRLTSRIGGKTVRLRIPKDYVSALYPGSYFGYESIDLIAYLPDMVSEQAYEKIHPLEQGPYPTMPNEQVRKRLYFDVSNSYGGPNDPTGELGFITEPIAEIFTDKDRPLRGNPYPQYNAYIWSSSGGDTIDSKYANSTYYVPKNRSPFYVFCLNQDDPYSYCSLLFIVDSVLEVEVDIKPDNIPQAQDIFQKVTAFLDLKIVRPRG